MDLCSNLHFSPKKFPAPGAPGARIQQGEQSAELLTVFHVLRGGALAQQLPVAALSHDSGLIDR